MGRKRKPDEYLRGTVTHRRTQDAYLAATLDAVSEEDWRDVVRATVREAKAGDPSARAFLAAYLIGKPAASAPTPLTVIVQQATGSDALVERLASPLITRAKYGRLDDSDSLEYVIRSQVAAELARKLPPPDPLKSIAVEDQELAVAPVLAPDSASSDV